MHGYLLVRAVATERDRQRAAVLYPDLLRQDTDVGLWSTALRQQIFLGDEDFVQRMNAALAPAQRSDREWPHRQRSPPIGLAKLLQSGMPLDALPLERPA